MQHALCIFALHSLLTVRPSFKAPSNQPLSSRPCTIPSAHIRASLTTCLAPAPSVPPDESAAAARSDRSAETPAPSPPAYPASPESPPVAPPKTVPASPPPAHPPRRRSRCSSAGCTSSHLDMKLQRHRLVPRQLIAQMDTLHHRLRLRSFHAPVVSSTSGPSRRSITVPAARPCCDSSPPRSAAHGRLQSAASDTAAASDVPLPAYFAVTTSAALSNPTISAGSTPPIAL